jgi:hypothetical protein
MRPWVLVLVGSLFLGSALGALAPASWTFRWTDGVLLGSALYVAGLRRYVERREGEAALAAVGSAGLVAGMLPGLLLRAALFVAILSVQATLCFQVVPEADIRRGFVVLSAWVVMQALIDTGTARGAVPATAASRPPVR